MTSKHEMPCGGGENCASPEPLQHFSPPPGARETVLAITGMDCPDEIPVLEQALRPLPGVLGLTFNLIGGTVAVAHDDSANPHHFIAAIAPTGMTARLAGDAPQAAHAAGNTRTMLVAASGVLTGLGLILAAPAPVVTAINAAAIIAGGWFIFPKAIAAARRLAPDMNLLMLIAVTGAAFIGEWSEGAAVTFLFGLSELLESFSVQRARRAIESLLALTPQVALVKTGDTFAERPVADVKPEEIVAVKSGQRVPLDGVVTTGASAVNQAPITGESLPVEKKTGDPVFAGTINGEGSLEVRVTKASGDTMLAKIVKLVGEAQSQRAPAQRFVDGFARIYTPAVMLLAALVFLLPPLVAGGAWGVWFYRALVLLVIACPCALVIATPVSIVSGLTALARRGVLVKGGAHLETLGKLRALAVDKTGTITEGRPRVLRAVTFGTAELELVRIVAAIDTHSEHPMARAVVAHAEQNNITFPRGENYRSHTGRGATASVEEHDYFVGNHRFAHELGACSETVERALAEIEARGESVVIVGHTAHGDCPAKALGILTIGDSIRPQAVEALRAIHAAGVEKIVMLSGDNQRTADAIAREAGIDEAHGDLLPDDKLTRIRALAEKFTYVGMVGDGVNDAPAMAAASLGIAMGKAGTDTAIETADMALMQDDLRRVADAIALGRRTVRIIQFNIAFALAIKALFLVLALLGHTSLWLAILADTGATLIVIANALRLLRAPVP
ncbi:MAG: putative cadmium-transporting ATPase [Verrucomicrobiota bacterium]|jgi:Cd2+/Zn2+-exporting ATPase